MSLPILSRAQMREWETATWATGQTEAEVIRRVGTVVARHALQLTRPHSLIVLLAGKGHNGDDVRAAQNALPERRVELLNVTDPQKDLPKLEALLSARPALVVDGLFGIGLDRVLNPDWVHFIQRLNAARLPVLAVDLPSGLDADTGEPYDAAVTATVTLTIGAPKLGLIQPAAWPFTGRIEVAEDVGLAATLPPSELRWVMPADFAGFPPVRQVAGHKGTYGHLGIVAGSFGYHGAAVLAARGAQRARPGLITLFPQENVYHPVAAQLQAVMVSPWSVSTQMHLAYSAVLMGPGLAGPLPTNDMKQSLRRLWIDDAMPIVVDATALDWITPHPFPQRGLQVVTPHPGEAGRLLKKTVEQIQANRVQTLREISGNFGHCWVVLKGHLTLVGRATGEIYVNSTGNPFLAQGGSGDLLSGYIAGLIAQPELQADPLQTISYAVWQHGAAADWLTREHRNWVVEDLAAAIGSVGAPG